MTSDTIDRSIHLRLAMAIDAPSHIKWIGDFHDFHPVDLTVTIRTVEAALDVRGVTELHVIGHVMNFYPFHRSTTLPMAREFLDLRAISRHLCMAVHAGVDAGHRRVRTLSWAYMAVPAGNLVNSGVELVTEGEGLFRGVTFPRIKTGGNPDCYCQ